MGYTVPTGKPGVGPSTYISNPRDIFYGNPEHAQYLPFPATVDGLNSSNPQNAPYTWLLYAGTLLGLETSSLKFACSIIGPTTAPLGGAQTTLYTDVNSAAYLVQRQGTSGTFTLTGGPQAGQTARSLTVTYSAVNLTTGAVTITPTATGAVSGVNQINSLVTVDSTGSGTFILTIEGISTAAITYSATAATLVTNINAALNATFGTSAVVDSGASLAANILTFSGTGYAARPIGTVTATILAGSTGYTLNGSGTIGVPSVCPVTTAGVVSVPAQEGQFISGSYIGPTDGSQIPRTLICDKFGLKVIDQLNTTRVDVFDGLLWGGGGVINTGFIVNYPTDSGLQAWVKSNLKNFVGWGVFSDDYIGQ
jgi:hypothetical protein